VVFGGEPQTALVVVVGAPTGHITAVTDLVAGAVFHLPTAVT